jgi:hypothetical protein
MTDRELALYLREAKLLESGTYEITPLTGGVSSDIVVVKQGGRAFVVKQALAKLKVADDWFADVSRNRVECQALEYCAGVMPTAVPRLLHADPDVPLFVMEYLGQECVAWKTPLVEGDIQPAMASRSACAGSRARGLQSQEHPGLFQEDGRHRLGGRVVRRSGL